MYYWFSPSQEKVTDTLCDFLYVQSDGVWKKYTEATSRSKPSGKWPDYELVAHGTNLPVRHEKNPRASRVLGEMGAWHTHGDDWPGRRR